MPLPQQRVSPGQQIRVPDIRHRTSRFHPPAWRQFIGGFSGFLRIGWQQYRFDFIQQIGITAHILRIPGQLNPHGLWYLHAGIFPALMTVSHTAIAITDAIEAANAIHIHGNGRPPDFSGHYKMAMPSKTSPPGELIWRLMWVISPRAFISLTNCFAVTPQKPISS